MDSGVGGGFGFRDAFGVDGSVGMPYRSAFGSLSGSGRRRQQLRAVTTAEDASTSRSVMRSWGASELSTAGSRVAMVARTWEHVGYAAAKLQLQVDRL